MKIEALAEIEATIQRYSKDSNQIGNYNELYEEYRLPLSRTYWSKGWYFLTFKPFNKTYEEDPSWYNEKLIRKVYDRFRPMAKLMWLTRETEATKTHVNLLIYTDKDISKYNDSIFFNKAKVFCVGIVAQDRFNIFNYIFKESKNRWFYYHTDYKYFDREEKISTPDRI